MQSAERVGRVSNLETVKLDLWKYRRGKAHRELMASVNATMSEDGL
jgi:hypothetical protein